jgi:hypothetical protein
MLTLLMYFHSRFGRNRPRFTSKLRSRASPGTSWQGGEGKSWSFLQKRRTMTRNRWVLRADLRFFSRESHASSEKIANAPRQITAG